MFSRKPAILFSFLIVYPSTACFRGVHTVVIKTEPADARLMINGEPGWNSPCQVRFPYAVAFIPWPQPVFPEAGIYQKSINVVIERDGFQTITDHLYPPALPPLGRHYHIGEKCDCNLPRVLGNSEYGFGKTFEYTFRLKEDHIDLKEASRILKVSPMTAFRWMQEGRFPIPVMAPDNKWSPRGALWRRADIEAWKPEADRLRNHQADESSNNP